MSTPDQVTFPSGATRGTQAIRGWYMLSQIALRRYADAMVEGAGKYQPYNWLKGIPVTNQLEHLYTHLAYFLQGDATEDHLGHALWNLASIVHYSETRPDLFDGLPPGCKEAMIEWLQSTDEDSPGRVNPLPREDAAEANHPSKPYVAATGHEPPEVSSTEKINCPACGEELVDWKPGSIHHCNPSWGNITQSSLVTEIARLKKALDETVASRDTLKRDVDTSRQIIDRLVQEQKHQKTLHDTLEEELRIAMQAVTVP